MTLTIPMPLIICIDDVGWWKGEDGSKKNQPFRTGMPRDHVPEDYLALADLGRKLDMQILAGFVLGEWDRNDALIRLPSANWAGKTGMRKATDTDKRIKAAEIIRGSESYMEFGLHGIGHEYWYNGVMQRSEFHDADCNMRDPDEIRKHLTCFLTIMDEYGFSPKPKTFIPPALKHSFGNGEEGIQKILGEFGIEFVTLCFSKSKIYSPPQTETIAWENNVLLVERGESEIPWNQAAAIPQFRFDRPVMALHWANILHPNPGKNHQVIEQWTDYIKRGCEKNGIILARDTKSCFTQYCHRNLSAIEKADGGLLIDVQWMDKVPSSVSKNPFFLKLDLPERTTIEIFGATLLPCLRPSEKPFLKLQISGSERKIFIRPRRAV